jgi:hypothetical protein
LVIPVAVNPVRPSSPLLHHVGHCDDIPMLLGRNETSPRRPLRHLRPPVNGTLESAHYGGRTTNRCATTLEAAHVRAQDAPRCLNRSRIHQDGRQLHGTARHAATRREIMWHACKLLPLWPIKGGVVPQPRGEGTTDSNHSHALHFSPRYWRSPQSLPLGLGGQASSPTTLVGPLYEHHDARQYSASSTPLLDDGPDRNQDKPSVISC